MSICGKKFRLDIPSDLASIPLIRNFVDNVAGMAGFKDRGGVVAAAEEAARNVILHAFSPGENASFGVICEPTDMGLRIIIQEKGMPFDPSLLPGCNAGEAGSRPDEGICMMKSKMDEVSFHNLGKAGKETHLFKYLDDKSVGSCMSAGEIEKAARVNASEPPPKSSVPYTVRRMEPAEAIEVSKSAYSAYHYSYFYEYMYYPERIRKCNETGEMISYVAVTQAGEIMGHAALKGDKERGVAEIMAAFVKPQYRGQGCLNALSKALIEEGRRRDYTGLFVKAVTSHNFSQKTALKYGFSACGLFLAQHDALEFMNIRTGEKIREAMLFAFVYLRKPGPFRIFPPPQHREFVLKMYEGLGAHPEASNGPTGLPGTDSIVRVSLDPYHTARIDVLQYGKDALSEIEKNVKALIIERIEAVYLFLNLCDPVTAAIARDFEKMGFFLAGINPGAPGKDLLVFQYLNNIRVDYTRLRFASDMGYQVAEYIRLRDPAQ